MKWLLALTLILYALPSYAQSVAQRNDNAATVLAGTNGTISALGVDEFGRLFVSGQITSLVPGTGATSLGKAEDAPALSGDTLVAAGAVIQGTLASSAADGDYGTLKTNTVGALYTTPGSVAATPSTATVAFGSVQNTFTTALTNSARLKLCILNNTLNTAISWDDSTTAILSGQPANTVMVIDFAQLGLDVRSNIRLKYETAPASGNVYINCLS